MNEEKIVNALKSVKLSDRQKRLLEDSLAGEMVTARPSPLKPILAAAACALAAAVAFGLWHSRDVLHAARPAVPTEGASGTALTTGTNDGETETAGNTAQEAPTAQHSPAESATGGEKTEPTSEFAGNLWALGPGGTPSVHWRTLIRGEKSENVEKYPCPRPGTHAFSWGLSKALEENRGRDDVNYYVRLEVYRYTSPDENGVACRDLSPEEALAFYDSLRERYYESVSIDEVGFEISSAMLWGETKSVTFGAIAYDASFFDHFPDLPDVGVFVSLYDEVSEIK